MNENIEYANKTINKHMNLNMNGTNLIHWRIASLKKFFVRTLSDKLKSSFLILLHFSFSLSCTCDELLF